MSKSEDKGFLSVIFATMGWPLFWGTLLCVAFYALIHYGLIGSDMVNRYFTGHPVEYIEAALFFVGVASLTAKGLDVVGQFGTLSQVQLVPRTEGGQAISEVPGLIAALRELPGYIRNSYLVQRLTTTLEFVDRKGGGGGLEEELKHQSELDSMRQYEGFALVRMIIWATPMLGFLGTVIGITLALGNLSPQALVATPEKAMEGLLAGLSVAFDTTALALTLSMVLMFCLFIVNQMETSLLEAVDKRVDRELVGRFADVTVQADPQLASVSKMSQAVLQAVESLVERQAELWNQSLRESQQHWDHITKAAGTNIEACLESAFRRSIREHAQELARHEQDAQLRTDHRWEQLQSVLKDNAEVMRGQQVELVKQGDLMLQAINATGEVTKVQHALNENMRSLSLMGKFDETVMSLSAAINILNARLGAPKAAARRVQLYQGDDQRSKAA